MDENETVSAERAAAHKQIWGPGEGVESVPAVRRRAPWATWPKDGSGRLNWTEGIIYGIGGAVVVVALFIMAALFVDFGSSPDVPPVATTVTAVHDADLIRQGAFWSWRAADSCGYGPAECHAALREINGAAAAYGLTVYEDGSVTARDN